MKTLTVSEYSEKYPEIFAALPSDYFTVGYWEKKRDYFKRISDTRHSHACYVLRNGYVMFQVYDHGVGRMLALDEYKPIEEILQKTEHVLLGS